MNVDDQRHEPGVCHEPVSWDVLQDIVQDGSVDALGTLGRTVKDLEIYDEFKDKVIRREYASTVDYLMIKVFECESKLTSDGKLYHVKSSHFRRRKVILRRNDFPYNWEDGIEHYLLWSNEEVPDHEIEGYIQDLMPHCSDYLWFVNPAELKSIPEIWHAHVIVNRSDG